MTTPESVLAAVPLFSSLSKKELANLMRNAHDRTFPAGAVLTEEQEIGATFGVILEGQAAVTVHGADRLKAITSVANSGSVAFHRRLGFDVRHVEDYDGPGIPMMVMTRPLPI